MPPLTTADGTAEDVTAIVPTVHLTTDTAMAGGIMVTIMYTAVSLVVTRVVAAWIDHVY